MKTSDWGCAHRIPVVCTDWDWAKRSWHSIMKDGVLLLRIYEFMEMVLSAFGHPKSPLVRGCQSERKRLVTLLDTHNFIIRLYE